MKFKAKTWNYQFEKCQSVYPFNYCISLFFLIFNICFYISSSSVIPLTVYLWKSIFLLLPAHLFVLCTYCERIPYLLSILHSSFIAFPGKGSFQLFISACPQPASAWLWGDDGWRRLQYVAFPLTLPAASHAWITGEVLCFTRDYRKLKGSNWHNKHSKPLWCLYLSFSQDGGCPWRWLAAAEGQGESRSPLSRELLHGQLLAGSLFL